LTQDKVLCYRPISRAIQRFDGVSV